MRYDPLKAHEIAALHAYAKKHGRRWKSILNGVWMGLSPYDDAGTLRNLRNSHGPTWLDKFKFTKEKQK